MDPQKILFKSWRRMTGKRTITKLCGWSRYLRDFFFTKCSATLPGAAGRAELIVNKPSQWTRQISESNDYCRAKKRADAGGGAFLTMPMSEQTLLGSLSKFSLFFSCVVARFVPDIMFLSLSLSLSSEGCINLLFRLFLLLLLLLVSGDDDGGTVSISPTVIAAAGAATHLLVARVALNFDSHFCEGLSLLPPPATTTTLSTTARVLVYMWKCPAAVAVAVAHTGWGRRIQHRKGWETKQYQGARLTWLWLAVA